jgi:hypothetical protein
MIVQVPAVPDVTTQRAGYRQGGPAATSQAAPSGAAALQVPRVAPVGMLQMPPFAQAPNVPSDSAPQGMPSGTSCIIAQVLLPTAPSQCRPVQLSHAGKVPPHAAPTVVTAEAHCPFKHASSGPHGSVELHEAPAVPHGSQRLVAATQVIPGPQTRDVQSTSGPGGDAQDPHAALLVPSQKPLSHCEPNAHAPPRGTLPGIAQSSGETPVRKSEQDIDVTAVVHRCTVSALFCTPGACKPS